MEKLCMIYITAKDKTEAECISLCLIRERLAACANIIDNVKSCYIWEGKEEIEDETLIVAKTRESLLTEIEKKVKELHSYDCPCILAYPLIYASDDYKQWLLENTRQ